MNIHEIKTNIRRLEHTLRTGAFSAGYVAQCRETLASYRKRLEELEADEEGQDLFEDPASLPEAVRDILDAYGDCDPCARVCEALERALAPLGYSFEWGLCFTPFNLKRSKGTRVLPFRSICRGLFLTLKAEDGVSRVIKKHVPGLGYCLYAYDSSGAMICKAAKTGEFFELMPRMI